MSNKLQRETNHMKFPTSGIVVILFFLVFFSSLSFQVTNRVLDVGDVSIPPTKVSAADPHKIPGKTADHFIGGAEEKEEENKEEKSSKHSLGAANTSFGFQGLKSFLISKTFFNPAFVFYHKVSLYILFRSLRLDLA